jgi:2-dehydro-3-deoxyphosphogluconate aldolase/(4S)-4-hydroxy-2-oxoglutarate aldolase
MMNKNDLLNQMCDCGLLPVFRTDETEKVLPTSEAFFEGGVTAVEITLTMPGAINLLETVIPKLPKGLAMGAGTVLDAESARIAILAGAQFVVSPGLAPEVIEMAHRYGVAVVPGAVTPTEIMNAIKLGVDVIKIFPATSVGPAHFADVLGPFPQIRFMAAAGITLENTPDYIHAGAQIVTQLAEGMDAEAFRKGKFENIAKRTKQFIQVIQKSRMK